MTSPVDPRFTSVTALDRQVAQQAKAEWYRMSLSDLQGSFTDQFVPAVVPDLTMAQAAAATLGASHIGATTKQPSSIIPQGFAGYASDGRSLPSLLAQPLIEMYSNLDNGMDSSLAMDRGWDSIDRMLAGQVHDAARQAESVQMVEHKVRYYIRFTEPGACARCIILAGRHYKISDGFLRHTNCLPAGVTVSGPMPRAATRRWYEGELVTISTASGQKLSITGNHPVLTDRGWVPANLIEEGDQVVRSTLAKGAVPLVVPDKKHVPTLVEDVWRSDSMGSLHRVPTTTQDFHGDGMDGYVDVVRPDSFLRNVRDTSFVKPSPHLGFTRGLFSADGFSRERAFVQSGGRAFSTAHSSVRGFGQGFAPGGGEPLHTNGVGLRSVSQGHTCGQPTSHGGALDSVLPGQGEHAGPGFIFGDQLFGVGQGGRSVDSVASSPNWDACGDPATMEGASAYASRGVDLLGRLTGQVELDRVIKVTSSEFADHVYNLDSVEGWYAADGLIVSNCRCYHIPHVATYLDPDNGRRGELISDQVDVPYGNDFKDQSPQELFDALSTAEQDHLFTIAGAQAIRDGASIAPVVNSRRSGMSTATDRYGTVYKTTTVGAKRGKTRLLPESIAKIAGDDHELWIKLLIKNNYLRP